MSGSGDTTSCLMSVEALSIRPSLRSHLTQFEKIKMRTRRSEKLEAEPLGVKSESEANAKVETKKPTVKRKVKSDPSVKQEPGPSSKLESGSSVKDESKPKVKLAAEEHQHEVEMEASEDEEEEMESTSREGDSVPDPGVYKSVRKPKHVSHLVINMGVERKHFDKDEFGVYRCPEEFCFYSSRNQSKFRQHYKIHSGERQYKCRLCDKTFRLRATCVNHVRTRVVNALVLFSA